MAKNPPRYPELERFIKNFLDARGWTAKMAANVLWPISAGRIHDWMQGRRTMDGWEASHFARRTGLLIPANVLRGIDKFGRVRKNYDAGQRKMNELLEQCDFDVEQALKKDGDLFGIR